MWTWQGTCGVIYRFPSEWNIYNSSLIEIIAKVFWRDIACSGIFLNFDEISEATWSNSYASDFKLQRIWKSD